MIREREGHFMHLPRDYIILDLDSPTSKDKYLCSKDMELARSLFAERQLDYFGETEGTVGCSCVFEQCCECSSG